MSAHAKSTTDEAATSVIATTSRLAWATSCFAFSVGGMRFVSPGGEPVDAILGFMVGGGAAYLALALNRVPEAVVGAMRIAVVAGVANGLMLPLAVFACIGGTAATDWLGLEASLNDRTLAAMIGLGVALSAAVAPWLFYFTMRTRHVRQWFDAAKRSHHVPAGIWLSDEREGRS